MKQQPDSRLTLKGRAGWRWKLKADTHHPHHCTMIERRREAATHLWIWRALWRFSWKPWRLSGGCAEWDVTERSGAAGGCISSSKKKSKFLLLPHKTQHHRNPVPSQTDSYLNQWQTRCTKQRRGSGFSGPIVFERRWAYSTVWIVLSSPRPPGPLERGKMEDLFSPSTRFTFKYPKYQHRNMSQ